LQRLILGPIAAIKFFHPSIKFRKSKNSCREKASK
jgi:hypothetical protein